MRRTENPEIQVQILSVPHQASLVACFSIAPLYKPLQQCIVVLYPTWFEGLAVIQKTIVALLFRSIDAAVTGSIPVPDTQSG